MASERIQILVSETGSRIVRKEIEGIGQAALGSGASVSSLKGALLNIVTGAGVIQLAKMADEITRLRNRLTIVTSTTGQANLVFDELKRISNETRSSLAATGDLYTRLALATKNLGLSQRDALNITETLNKAVILSGANSREAEAGILQFSQGLASGRLAGDELRAVLEQLPYVADILAKELGVTRGALRALARDGEITPEVIINAFKRAGPEVEKAFANTIPTISQSFTILHNAVLIVLDDMNKANGIFSVVADTVIYLSKNVEYVARIAIGGLMVGAVVGLTLALSALTAVILANPIGALLVGIVSGIALITAFSDKVLVGIDSVTKFSDVLSVVFSDIVAVGRTVLTEISRLLGSTKSYFDFTLADVIRLIASFVDNVLNVATGLYKGVQAVWSSFAPETKTAVAVIYNTVVLVVEKILNVFIGLGKSIGAVWDRVSGFIKRNIQRIIDATDNLLTTLSLISEGRFEEAWEKFSKVGTLVLDNAEDGVDTLFNSLADAGDEIGNQLEKTWIPRMNEIYTEGGKDAGKAFTEAFLAEQKKSNVGNYVESVFARAKDISSARTDANLKTTVGGPGLDEPGSPDTSAATLRQITLEKFMNKLREETNSLAENNRERRITLALVRAETSLREKGAADLTAVERLDIQTLLMKHEALEDVNKALDIYRGILPVTIQGQEILAGLREETTVSLTEMVEQYAAGEITMDQFNLAVDKQIQSLNDQAEIYDLLRDPMEVYERRLEAIAKAAGYATTAVQKSNLETAKTVAYLESIKDDKSIGAGFSRAIAKTAEEFKDIGALAEQTLVNAFKGAEDALVSFIQKGKADLRGLFESIQSDLIRLAVRQAITGPLLNAFSPTPKASGGMAANGMFMVGENGPELLRMGNSAGYIYDAQETRAAARGGGKGGDTNVTNVSMTVNTSDADSFRRSRLAIKNDLKRISR